jgi:hypothetical protein
LEEGFVDLGNGRDTPQVAYASDLGRLLRFGGERRGKEKAERGNHDAQAASVHVPSWRSRSCIHTASQAACRYATRPSTQK